MNDKPYELHVDAREMICPMPLLKLKQALNQIDGGEIVSLVATDPTSKRDITAFARLAQHKLSCVEDKGELSFLVTKKEC